MCKVNPSWCLLVKTIPESTSMILISILLLTKSCLRMSTCTAPCWITTSVFKDHVTLMSRRRPIMHLQIFGHIYTSESSMATSIFPLIHRADTLDTFKDRTREGRLQTSYLVRSATMKSGLASESNMV
jgi:hypothetical protein